MEHTILPSILFIADIFVFASIVLLNLAKKSAVTVYLYVFQSLVISFLMFYGAYLNSSKELAIIAALIFSVKVIGMPIFFMRQIKKQTMLASSNNYLSLPLTLGVIALISGIAHSKFFQPLVTLAPANEQALLISVTALFISLFLIINQKGALSQMVGVLSLENAIVSFAYAAGLEQGLGLQLGLIFDVFVWIIIATVFVSMIYKKFNTLDVSVMTKLKG
jgi:hydrogenase-4 component E